MRTSATVLVVDDDPVFRRLAADALRENGYAVLEAASADEAIGVLPSHRPDVILLDVVLPDRPGSAVLEAAKTQDPDCEIIAVSGAVDRDAAMGLIRAGAMDFLPKPFDKDQILLRVRTAWQLRTLSRRPCVPGAALSFKAFGPDLASYLPLGVLHLDTQLRVHGCNRAFERLFGLPCKATVGLDLRTVLEGRLSEPERLFDALRGLLEHDRTFDLLLLNNRLREGDPSVHLRLSAGSVPGGILLFFQDVTEDYRLRQDLILNEKRATLGEFIATVTHGLGNNMMNILANVAGLQDEVRRLLERLTELERVASDLHPDISRLKSEISLVRDAIVDYCERLNRRAFEMDRNIKSLLEYGRQQSDLRVPTDLNVVVSEAASVVQSIPAEAGVVWVSRLAPKLPPIPANPHKLKDALVDLMLNAVQSIPPKPSGRVEYSTRWDEAARTVSVSVRDTGSGIPPEHRAMVFKAFFTTKRTGTGLGLANVKNVVKQHGGEVTFEDAPGGGTVFTLTFPVPPDSSKPGGGDHA